METFKVSAPTRADLAGGTLDLWPLYCLFGGAKTINVALDLVAVAQFEVSPHPEFVAEIAAEPAGFFTVKGPMDWGAIRQMKPSVQFPVAILSKYLERRNKLPAKKVRIKLHSGVPHGSGLGGSSALCVAMAKGLSRVFSDFVEQGWQWQMLGWVKDLEAAFLRTPTGTQDYLAALFGGLQCYISQIGSIECVPFPKEAFDELSERTLILFSGEMHHSGLTNWELFKKALEGDKEILSGLSSIRDIADQMNSELRAKTIRWKHVGQLISEEWKTRKSTFHVETKRLDEILQFLNQNDVLGCKVCGAANGGSLLALVEPERRKALTVACQEKGIQILPAQCAPRGVSIEN